MEPSAAKVASKRDCLCRSVGSGTFRAMHQVNNYSDRNESMGLPDATLMAWKLIVRTASTIEMMPANTNISHPMLIR